MKRKSNFLERIFAQPDTLPEEFRKKIKAETHETVRIFAFCDLDPGFQFKDSWLAATDHYLIQAKSISANGSEEAQLKIFSLAEIDHFDIIEGITINRLNAIGKKENELLTTVFFTRRQMRAIGNLRFVVEQECQRIHSEKDQHELHQVQDPAEKYYEAVIQAIKDARGAVLLRDKNVFIRLLKYLKPHKNIMLFGFASSLFMTILGLFPPYLTRILVDDVLQPAQKGEIARPEFWIWLIVGGLAFIWVASQIANFLRLRIMSIVGEKIVTRLRDDLYQHLQRLSLSFYNQRSTGSIISRLTSDTDRLWDFITFGIIEFIISIITLIGVATALFLQDARLAAIVVLPLPLMIYLFYRHSIRIQGMFLRIWRKWSAMTSVLSDVIPGIRVVRAFAREKFETKRFHQKNMDVRSEAFTLHNYWTAFWPKMVTLMHFSSFLVWAFGAPQVLRYMQTGGQQGMPLGVFIAFTGYMGMFWAPLQNIGNMTRTLNRATSSAARVFEILDTAPAIISRRNSLKLNPLEGHIVFDNVTFTYDGVRNVLKEVSFEVYPGEMIGIVGPSGSGKSTLINLICRFYDVSDGAIYIDGCNIRDLDLANLRQQIGMVLQEPYLFRGTIAENIAYGKPKTNLKQIIEASKAANAHEFICTLPDAYDSMVGERGFMLSGGERQRVSIARAILHNPNLLILDEATSSVDTETERKIQEALKRLITGRTTFAIAHRLSTLNNASRLFVLENGRLIEQGTHAELLSREDGTYARLHQTQAELQSIIAV